MRRHLRSELPQFSAVFGIHPWDVDRLTLREISDYLTELQRLRTREG